MASIWTSEYPDGGCASTKDWMGTPNSTSTTILYVCYLALHVLCRYIIAKKLNWYIT